MNRRNSRVTTRNGLQARLQKLLAAAKFSSRQWPVVVPWIAMTKTIRLKDCSTTRRRNNRSKQRKKFEWRCLKGNITRRHSNRQRRTALLLMWKKRQQSQRQSYSLTLKKQRKPCEKKSKAESPCSLQHRLEDKKNEQVGQTQFQEMFGITWENFITNKSVSILQTMSPARHNQQDTNFTFAALLRLKDRTQM